MKLLNRADGSRSNEKSLAVLAAVVNGLFAVAAAAGYEASSEVIVAVNGILASLYAWFMRERANKE